MPIEITLEKKSIVRNAKNSLLINTCQEVLRTAAASLEALDLENAKNRKGFIPARILPLLEFATNLPQGAKIAELPVQSLMLDTASWMLWREYINFLNNLLIAENLGPKETDPEKGEVESSYAVMRELLYRLVATVLSNSDDGNDKEKLLKAITMLIDHESVRKLFTEDHWYWKEGKNTTFLIELRRGNGEWFQRFKEMLDRNNLIYLNQRAITTSINTLKKIESIIQAYLIVCLDSTQLSEAYTPLWLDTTLRNAEKKYLVKEKETAIQNLNNLSVDTEQKRVSDELTILKELDQGNSISQSISQKVKTLYKVYRETCRLGSVLSHLDSVILFTGWIVILLDIFDFDKLSELLASHHQMFKEALIFPQELKHLEKKTGLGRHPTTGVDLEMTKTVSRLHHLQDIEIKQYIKQSLFLSIKSLINLQQEYYSNCAFINITTLKKNGLLMESPSQSGLLLEFTQNELQRIQKENQRLQAENKRLQLTHSNSTLEPFESAHLNTVTTAEQSIHQAQSDVDSFLASTQQLLGSDINESTRKMLEEMAGTAINEKASQACGSGPISPILNKAPSAQGNPSTSSTISNNNSGQGSSSTIAATTSNNGAFNMSIVKKT